MFLYPEYADDDRAHQVGFMRRYPFATVVTGGAHPLVTHLPLVVAEEGGKLILRGHMHRMNAQWKAMEAGGEVLAVFNGPHGYVSPKLYRMPNAVPTWNYVALHAYGAPRLLPSNDDARAVLEASIMTFEPEYWEDWLAVDPDYVKRLLPQLMAFEVEVREVLFQKKLSQDKGAEVQGRVAGALGGELGRWMRENTVDPAFSQGQGPGL